MSEEVAREMLEGLKTDVAISTTGIAGPGGGTKRKTCWACIYWN